MLCSTSLYPIARHGRSPRGAVMEYILVFRGELEPDVTQAQAAAVIGEKLGRPAAQVEERLFIGKPVRVDKVATKAEARRYVDIFKEAGAKLEVRVPRPVVEAEQPDPVGDSPEPAGDTSAPVADESPPVEASKPKSDCVTDWPPQPWCSWHSSAAAPGIPRRSG